MDIENTLKALNLDFMQTYTDLDKNDSEETILNEKFSNLVSSIEDEISSATASLKSAVYSYSNGVQTMFDFNAATNHLDKHLQHINNLQTAQNSLIANSEFPHDITKIMEDKRSSTPDTGFASRDTNISLSRRSSQKSSYSPQDFYANSPKETHFPNSTALAMGMRDESPLAAGMGLMGNSHRYVTAGMAAAAASSPLKTPLNNSNTSVYSMNQGGGAKMAQDFLRTQSARQRSMSFNDNRISPVMSEPQRHHQNAKYGNAAGSQRNLQEAHSRRSVYKSRSIRARTLRRLSYNPTTLDSSSSSSSDDNDFNRSNLARSECDIRFKSTSRRRAGFNRKVASLGQEEEAAEEDERQALRMQHKMYGSNASIKSAPHYNFGQRASSMRLGNYNRSAAYESYAHGRATNNTLEEQNIYDFGGGGKTAGGNNYAYNYNAHINNYNKSSNQAYSMSNPPHSTGSGSSSNNSAAASNQQRYNDYNPPTHYINSSPESNRYHQTNTHPSPPKTLPLPLMKNAPLTPRQQQQPQSQQTEFQWPEKIRASTVQQNDMQYRKQMQQNKSSISLFTTTSTNQQQRNISSRDYSHSRLHVRRDSSSSSSSSSSDSAGGFEFRSEFIPHIPPSPAP